MVEIHLQNYKKKDRQLKKNILKHRSPNAIINWNDTPIIPNDELQAEINKLQAEYDAEEWKRNRKAEYPTHEDCIHALLDGGDTLTELQEKRQAVKSKYPKP